MEENAVKESGLIGRWIFDEEVYPNLWLLCAKNVITKERRIFQVSPLADDRPAFMKWFNEEVVEMVGFNNIFYDYPVLHHALMVLWNLRGRDFCEKLFKYSDDLINGKKRVFLKEHQHFRRQIDLFKINHFDNKAKTASLKLLEFNLKMSNIQELPFPVGTVLQDWQIRKIIEYCDNDVDATELVYDVTLPEIELREKLSPQYKIDFTNYNSTKMGEWILVSKVINSLGEEAVYNIHETDRGIKKEIINTKRESIALKDVIFDYVQFTTEPFEKILEWFKSRTIKETKGVFSGIPFDELTSLEPHYRVQKKVGKQKTLNVVYKDFQYDFGVGGIHGSVKSGIYVADDNYELWDWDVASYYPNLAIKNKFYPAHYGEVFCDIYEGIYNERTLYPKKVFPMENLALKLALNGSYGKSNSEFSPLYDPLYTMKTTVNGQLLLCMLSERLMEEIPDCQMIQINTDGMTVRVHKNYIQQMKDICARWERLTQLELENVQYSKMIIKDVNNYMAIKLDGSVKRKGAAFIHKIEPGELELHKDFSMLVVQKSLEKYFVNGIKPEEAIRNHDNIYDFFKRTKISRSDKLYSREYDNYGTIVSQEDQQRITRYYVSGSQQYDKDVKRFVTVGNGKSLIKEMPPLDPKLTKKLMAAYDKAVEEDDYEGTLDDFRKESSKIRNTNMEAGYLCTVCNDLADTSEEFIRGNLNYQYYIDEVYKIIKQIENE